MVNDKKVLAHAIKALHGKMLVVNLGGPADYYTFFRIGRYSNGRIAIELEEKDGTPFATLTCNLPTMELNGNEVFIKTWSDNEEVAKAALASGRFKDTGKRVSTGFVLAQVWEVL
jgi:hypothetical protein